MNNKLGRIPFVTTWFYVFLAAVITWQEYYTFTNMEDFKNLLVLRIIVVGSIIPVAFVLRKNPFSVWANSFFCFNLLAYTCVGHYYRPLYFACYLQALYAFSFLFFTSRRLYFSLSTVKTILFTIFYLYTYDLVKYRPGPETKDDFIVSILVAYGFGLLIHHFFTAERGLREAANERFVLLGRHASNIIHDIKGSIGIPHMYIGEIRQSLESKDYAQAKEYLDKMQASLSRTEKTIFDLNQLSRLATEDGKPFMVSEGLKDVLELLTKRLHDVDVRVVGDFEVKGDRAIVCSIFLNLILNSLESFKNSGTGNPKIEVQISPVARTISITDNGGGFSQETLSALKGNHATVTTTSNSGLGLYLVRENLRTLKGKISFKNEDGGAKVEIKLG